MKLNLVENIRNLRKQYNMKQEQIAEALDVSVTAVSKWERGLATPELKYIIEMADLFEVSVDALIGYNKLNGACEAYEKRIHELQMEKDYENAAVEAEKGLIRYPNNFKLIYRCAELFHLKGMEQGEKSSLQKAIELWEKALLLISQNTDEEISEFSIRGEIAACYITLGQKEKGIELLKKCNIEGVHNAVIGMIYAKSEEFDPRKAAPFLEKGFFTCMGSLVQLMEGYTNYYVRMKDYESALEAQVWIAQYLENIGLKDKASIADKFLVINYIECARLSEILGDTKNIERYLKKSIEAAKRFDKMPSYHIRDLKFYLGELEDGIVYESTGITAMEAAKRFIEGRQCSGEFCLQWEKLKGEIYDETLE